MLVRTGKLGGAAMAAACFWLGLSAAAQTTPRQTAQTSPANSPASAADAARKAAILNSPEWSQAMFAFKEWLSSQQIYDAQQVEAIKAAFNQRVARMSARELEFLLADMEAKFKILNSPEAREARAWLGQYLAVMSDKKRAEVLKDVPNVATMTAAQLQREIMKIEQKRTTIEQEQAAFQRSQQALVSQQLAQDREAQQAYVRARSQFPTQANSPYRTPASIQKPFEDATVGPEMSYFVNPWGGVGFSIAPSSW
jgi:hypothetical protein